MKLKVLGWILIATILIAGLEYFGLLSTKEIIEVEARYMQYNCGKDNIDMRVTSSPGAKHLIGKIIAPELTGIDQAGLTKLVYAKTASFRTGNDSVLNNFTLVGYLRESNQKHCSGAVCFKVEQIKYAGDSTFTKFNR